MLLSIPDGDSCFLDANIFYYHFVETPPFSDVCTDLLERIAVGRIHGFSSIHVIAEKPGQHEDVQSNFKVSGHVRCPLQWADGVVSLPPSPCTQGEGRGEGAFGWHCFRISSSTPSMLVITSSLLNRISRSPRLMKYVVRS